MNNTPAAPQIQFSSDTCTRRLVGHAILSRFMGDTGELGPTFRAALEASRGTSQLQDLCVAVLSFRDYLDDVKSGGYNKILHKTMEVLVPAYAEIELGRLIWGPGRFFSFNSPIDLDYATKYCNIAALTMSRFRRVGNWSNAGTLTFADYPLNEAIFYFFDCLYEHLFWSRHTNTFTPDYKTHKYLKLKLHPNMINFIMRPVFQVHIDRAIYYVKNSSLPLHFKTPIQTMLQYAIHLDLRLLPTMLSIGYSKAHTIPIKASIPISKAQRKKRANTCQQKLIDDLTKLILSFLHPSIYNSAFDATRDISVLSVLLCACDDKKRKYFGPGKITFCFSSIYKALFENRDDFTIKLKYGVENLIHKHETKHIPRAIDFLHAIGEQPLVEVDLEILKLSPTILRRYGQFMAKFKVMLLTTSSETRWSFQENADMFTFSEWSDEEPTAASVAHSYVVHNEPWLQDRILQIDEKIDNLFFLGGSMVSNLKISGALCYAFYGQTPSRFTQDNYGFLSFLRARRSAKYIYRCIMSYFGNLDSMDIDLFGTGRRYHEKAVYLSEILLTATQGDQRNLESLRHKLKKIWVMKNKTRITERNISFFKATCEPVDVSANDCQDASKIDVSAPINLMVTLK
tara:strand:+ start:5079 stop:6959 length:1881 start_codon:yes stop_codon:yes gene_type:complete